MQPIYSRKRLNLNLFLIPFGIVLMLALAGIVAVVFTQNRPDVESALADANATFYVRGNFEEGLNKFRSLLVTHPTNANIWRDYGVALAGRLGNSNDLRPLQRAIELNPNDSLTYLYLTVIYLQRFKYPEAEAAAQKASQLDQQGWQGPAAQALYKMQTLKLDQAQLDLNAMQARAGSAVDEPFYNLLLSNLLFHVDDYKGGIKSAEKVANAWPNQPLGLLAKAQALLYDNAPGTDIKSNHEKAYNFILQAQKIQPNTQYVLEILAYYHTYYGQDSASGTTYANEILKLNQDDANVFQILGRLAFNEQAYDKANTYFQKCTNLDQYNVNCYTDWSFSLIWQAGELYRDGREGEAAGLYRAAMAKVKTLEPYLPKQGYKDLVGGYNYTLGLCHFYLEEYDEALSNFQKATQADPDAAVYHSYLGWAYYDYGESEKAEEEYQKAITLNPDDDTAKSLRKALDRDS